MLKQEPIFHESPSQIDLEKFGEFVSYRVYGAWQLGGVQDATGGFGTLSNMLENFAEL